jgi:hypothetical protein
VYYSFTLFVIALRNIGGMDALEYSERLVKGNWWRVFGVQLLSTTLSLIISGALIDLYRSKHIYAYSFLGIILPSMAYIVYALFNVILCVFFLNLDYLKNPPPIEPDALSVETT